jgi:hypothetical protein
LWKIWIGFSERSTFTMWHLGFICWIGGSVVHSVSFVALTSTWILISLDVFFFIIHPTMQNFDQLLDLIVWNHVDLLLWKYLYGALCETEINQLLKTCLLCTFKVVRTTVIFDKKIKSWAINFLNSCAIYSCLLWYWF